MGDHPPLTWLLEVLELVPDLKANRLQEGLPSSPARTEPEPRKGGGPPGFSYALMRRQAIAQKVIPWRGEARLGN